MLALADDACSSPGYTGSEEHMLTALRWSTPLMHYRSLYSTRPFLREHLNHSANTFALSDFNLTPAHRLPAPMYLPLLAC
ncbi:hypothetical protein KCP71_02925 [Salmonella enterica subsp. enterica]|nr:hypothetical protein KCP71_02925 [Salmonella enterica subsp. enterica]